MGILARYTLSNLSTPSRLYVHTSGAELYEDESPRAQMEYFINLVERNPGFLGSSLLVGIVWGDVERRQRVADVFAFDCTDSDWSFNPEIDSYVFRSSDLDVDSPVTCGDGLIVLGAEEQFRRSCKNLHAYMSGAPNIAGIGLSIESGVDEFI